MVVIDIFLGVKSRLRLGLRSEDLGCLEEIDEKGCLRVEKSKESSGK